MLIAIELSVVAPRICHFAEFSIQSVAMCQPYKRSLALMLNQNKLERLSLIFQFGLVYYLGGWLTTYI
jgi:hypothetical protein